jgi:hypothetical protein
LAVTDTLYTARFELPDLIERGRDNLLRCRVYREGALAAPASGTVTVYDASSTALVSVAATITAGEARYTLANATTTGKALGEGWRVQWALTMGDGVVHTFRNEAALVRAQPYPSVTEADLYRRVSSLDPMGNSITGQPEYAHYLDEAWVSIQTRLLAQGRRPWLIISPHALREPHLLLALALIFEDLASRLNLAYQEQGRMYREQYEGAWSRVRFAYDADDSGQQETHQRRPAMTSVFLSSTGARWRY